MGGGPKDVTSTTTNQPPEFLRGPLELATTAATGNFLQQQGGGPTGNFRGNDPTFFPSVKPGGPSTGGPGGVQFDGSGTSLIGQSQDLTSRTIAGDFLDPNSNPFLQQTFDRAADLTRTRLSSEFSGSGRNLGAALPARSEELQTLSSNIFGGNFQRERDRQVNAVNQSQDLDPINLLINRLAGIIPGAGGSTQNVQETFRTGLF